MEQRQLGRHGPTVSALGFGAMVLSPGMYGQVDDAASVRTIRHALDLGIDFVDTSDSYGPDGHNERLVGRAIADVRDFVVLATKWGTVARPDARSSRIDASFSNEIWVNAHPRRARECVERSLSRLGAEQIDLWYLEFPDPGVPVEESIGAMAELVQEGLVRHLGLCNASAEEIRRAHSVHPLAAVQNEFSIWTRDAERDVLPALQELGVGFVPWGPLGTGFLAGSADRIGIDDFRHNAPRFRRENLERNVDRFTPLRELAAELAVSPAELALAWIFHQGESIVPIPGSRRPDHVESNIAATKLWLSEYVLRRIDEIAPAGAAVGAALR